MPKLIKIVIIKLVFLSAAQASNQKFCEGDQRSNIEVRIFEDGFEGLVASLLSDGEGFIESAIKNSVRDFKDSDTGLSQVLIESDKDCPAVATPEKIKYAGKYLAGSAYKGKTCYYLIGALMGFPTKISKDFKLPLDLVHYELNDFSLPFLDLSTPEVKCSLDKNICSIKIYLKRLKLLMGGQILGAQKEPIFKFYNKQKLSLDGGSIAISFDIKIKKGLLSEGALGVVRDSVDFNYQKSEMSFTQDESDKDLLDHLIDNPTVKKEFQSIGGWKNVTGDLIDKWIDIMEKEEPLKFRSISMSHFYHGFIEKLQGIVPGLMSHIFRKSFSQGLTEKINNSLTKFDQKDFETPWVTLDDYINSEEYGARLDEMTFAIQSIYQESSSINSSEVLTKQERKFLKKTKKRCTGTRRPGGRPRRCGPGASLLAVEKLPIAIGNVENSRDEKLYKQLKNLKASYDLLYEDLRRLLKIYPKNMIKESDLTKIDKEIRPLFTKALDSFETRLSGAERQMSVSLSNLKVNKKAKLVEIQGKSCINGTKNSFISIRPGLPQTCVADYDMMVRLETEQMNLMFKNLFEAKGGPRGDSGYFSLCISSKIKDKIDGETKIAPCKNKNSGHRYEIKLSKAPQIISKQCKDEEPCGTKAQLKISLKAVGTLLGMKELGKFIKKLDSDVLVNLNLTSDGKDALFTSKDIELKSKFEFGTSDLILGLLLPGGALSGQLSLNLLIRPLITEVFRMLFLEVILNSSEQNISSSVDGQLSKFGFDIVEMHSIEGELTAFLKFKGGLFSTSSKAAMINKRKNFCEFIKAQAANK